MNILADECVWRITRDFLEQLEHDVTGVEDYHLSRSDDLTVLKKAAEEKRAFLTRDMHFSNMLIYPPSQFEGIIVLRIKSHTIHLVHQVLKAALDYFQDHESKKSLTIIDHNNFRIRR